MKLMRLAALAALLVAIGCSKSEPPAEQAQETVPQESPARQATPPADGIPTVAGDTITTASGLKYIDITVGTGETPAAGQTVAAHYTGWLTNGKKFDSSRDRGSEFTFPIGQGRVIKGWDEGIGTMKVGGRRLLIIPPDLGYGESGAGGVIPPGATLIFDVELLHLH